MINDRFAVTPQRPPSVGPALWRPAPGAAVPDDSPIARAASTVVQLVSVRAPSALACEDLVRRQASLVAVRLLGASPLLEERVWEAVIEDLDQRGLRVVVLSGARAAGAEPRSDRVRWERLSLEELGEGGGPVCDVLLVDGYDDVVLPSVQVRPADAEERCALYEVHASDAPACMSVRCSGDLARHAPALVDWMLEIAA